MIPIKQAISKRMRDDAGFTLIEVLIAMFLFAILTTVLFTVVLSSANTLTSIRTTTDLNEEARLVMNRMSRELRESENIISVTNPDGPSFDPNATSTAITFDVDFNGNGLIEPNASDSERLTYNYDRPNRRLLLQTSSQTLPILANNVEAFKLTYTSRNYDCDQNKDGTVTWLEVDQAPSPCPASAGNSNSLLDVELNNINSLTIELTVLTGAKQQDYRTQIDLRNQA
ncbi:MAG: type II secretion system protein J [Actinomycetota bacterium]|nr:prepilin-type N-terminal cleavage/methylation domain-containing protein [Actinomycetota bacterium]